MKKKLWSGLLALALAAMLPCAALAARGDANIARREEMNETYGDGVHNGCVLGDALYLCGNEHLFVYHVGDVDVTAIDLEFPEAREGEIRQMEYLLSDGERLRALFTRYVEDDESYSLDGLEIREVTVDGARATAGEAVEADISELVTDYGEAGSSYLVQINSACFVGEWLMLYVYDGGGYPRVYALDADSGEGFYIDGPEEIRCMTPYADGKLLLETCDYDEMSIGFYLYDPEADAAEAACEPIPMEEDSYSAFENPVYSAESGRLFYQYDGYVMAMEDFDAEGAQPVAEISSNIYGGTGGLLLPGDYYVEADYEVTAIRATDPEALPETRLVVEGSTYANAINDAYYSFANDHGDVAVVLDDAYRDGGELIESMMYQDDSVDIYVLSVNGDGFDALYSRGFMMEIDNAALTEAVARMYPAVQAVLTREGRVVAVPVQLYGWIPGFDYEGFAEIGIAREDVPTSWRELLELLPELPERLPEDGSVRIFDEYVTQESLRYTLVSLILDSWRNQTDAAGEDLSYDDPALASLLEAALKMDLGALGVAEEDEDESYATYSVGAGRARVLFSSGVSCTLGNFYGEQEPVPLRAREDLDACIPLSLTVAFVNPFSKNAELAQEFLAEVMDCQERETAYNLSDEYSEPVRDEQVLAALEDMREKVAGLRAKLETAEPVDVPAIEEDIANGEEYIANLEDNSWRISAENIAWYRSHAALLTVDRCNYLSVADEEGDLSDMAEQMMAGRMQVGDFLRQIDRKVHMRQMEGN